MMKHLTKRAIALLLILLLLPSLYACGKDEEGDPQDEPTPPSGITLTERDRTLLIGGIHTLTAEVQGSAEADKRVTWVSSNEAVATVSASGKVTAISPGTAVITAKTAVGEKAASCTVTVSDAPPPFSLDFSGIEGVTKTASGYIVATPSLALTEALVLREGVFEANLSATLVPETDAARLDGLTLSRTGEGSDVICLRISTVGITPAYATEIYFLLAD